MSTPDTAGQHTPGPVRCDHSDGHGISSIWIGNSGTTIKNKANARLMAAAYTSYDKHGGANAVALAEADHYGAALDALRAIVAYQTPLPAGLLEQARAVLALLPKSEGTR